MGKNASIQVERAWTVGWRRDKSHSCEPQILDQLTLSITKGPLSFPVSLLSFPVSLLHLVVSTTEWRSESTKPLRKT
jgi:hypothetical protein